MNINAKQMTEIATSRMDITTVLGYFGQIKGIVTATKGDRCPYSIGGGERGWCGTVTMGGTVTGPIGQSPYTYKP